MSPRVLPVEKGDTFVYLAVEDFTESLTTDQARELGEELVDAADAVDEERGDA